jgi:hypothetical protein
VDGSSGCCDSSGVFGDTEHCGVFAFVADVVGMVGGMSVVAGVISFVVAAHYGEGGFVGLMVGYWLACLAIGEVR